MRVARIYDSPEPGDGVRVLADRLWLGELRELAQTGPVTLLTSAKDVEHGHLVVLERLLENN